MGTIAEKLQYTSEAVDDIQAALIEKNISVADTDALKTYADKIRGSLSNSADADATAADILKDKTAYVNNAKVTGTMPNYAGQTISKTAQHSTLSSSIVPFNFQNGSAISAQGRHFIFGADTLPNKIYSKYGGVNFSSSKWDSETSYSAEIPDFITTDADIVNANDTSIYFFKGKKCYYYDINNNYFSEIADLPEYYDKETCSVVFIDSAIYLAMENSFYIYDFTLGSNTSWQTAQDFTSTYSQYKPISNLFKFGNYCSYFAILQESDVSVTLYRIDFSAPSRGLSPNKQVLSIYSYTASSPITMSKNKHIVNFYNSYYDILTYSLGGTQIGYRHTNNNGELFSTFFFGGSFTSFINIKDFNNRSGVVFDSVITIYKDTDAAVITRSGTVTYHNIPMEDRIASSTYIIPSKGYYDTTSKLELNNTESYYGYIFEALPDKGINLENSYMGIGTAISPTHVPTISSDIEHIEYAENLHQEFCATDYIFSLSDGREKSIYIPTINADLVFSYSSKDLTVSVQSRASSGANIAETIATTSSTSYDCFINKIIMLESNVIFFMYSYETGTDTLSAVSARMITYDANGTEGESGAPILHSSGISIMGASHIPATGVSYYDQRVQLFPLRDSTGNNVVEIGMARMRDTYSSAGKNTARILYWNDLYRRTSIKAPSGQLSLGSSAHIQLASVRPHSNYHYIEFFRTMFGGVCFISQSTSANRTTYFAQRLNGSRGGVQATHSLGWMNNGDNAAYGANGEGCIILGRMENGYILTCGYTEASAEATADPWVKLSAANMNKLYITSFSRTDAKLDKIAEIDCSSTDIDLDLYSSYDKLVLLKNDILLNRKTNKAYQIVQNVGNDFSIKYICTIPNFSYEKSIDKYPMCNTESIYTNMFYGIGVKK